MLMIRDTSNLFAQMSGMPINSREGKQLLKKYGIDTNSKQYKAVMKQMSSAAGAAVGYTNPQGIKNLMSGYDSNGNRIDPVSGLTGMDATNIPMSARHQIIKIPESSKQEIFDATMRYYKVEMGNADPSYRNEVFTNNARKMQSKDRLKGNWTLGQYERQYEEVIHNAIMKADPSWKPGKVVPAGVLDGITRESIDKTLVQVNGEHGETFTRRAVDVQL